MGKKIVCVLALIVGFVSLCLVFPTKEDVKKAIQAKGFTQVRDIQRYWYGIPACGILTDDGFAFTAKAVDPSGKPVEVVVCKSYIFTGFTLRSK